jgi:hypothetical protein
MTEGTAQITTSAPPAAPGTEPIARPKWWREALYIAGVYLIYSTVRNQFGSAGGPLGQSNEIAYGHARDIIDIQRAIGLWIEPELQRWYLALPADGFIQFWNVFYGTAHFVVTFGALIWLFVRAPGRYPFWRNTLAFTTILALIGFASFSLMPPRLLDRPQAEFGPPASIADGDYELVDTLAEYETFWSFDSGTLKSISNQYAAMPSLHIAWATWSAFVLYPMVRRRFTKALVVAYPFATLFCIMVTANHYWLDAVGGLVTLGAGALIASRVTAYWAGRSSARTEPADGPAVVARTGE